MIAVDTSILALALNRWAPEHARAAALVEDFVNGDAPWCVTWPGLHELIANVTHRHVVARPLGTADAVAYVAQLLESPALRALGATARHGAVLREIVEDWPHADAPTGLEVAAVLRDHGVREILSTDPGLERYRFLTVIDPFRGQGWRPDQPPVRRYRRLRRRRA